ncbi:MAG: cytochrome c biogenesis protein ResB [Deltaproteobacteria bacterium]|nr:cytochrome c biogenesis protein ResB [Deltaproteobacteria bacterium]
MTYNKGLSDSLKMIWNFFASVKLTVALLLSVAATSIIGTIIPQNESPTEYVRAFGDVLYRIFYLLGIFDMYHSWWFQFLLLMLAANVAVCSLKRLPATWKIVSDKNRMVNTSQIRQLSDKEQFRVNLPPERIQEIYLPYVSKKYGYARIEQTDDGYGIYAEKGRWTRLGVYAVHLSVLVLLLGGLIGSIFGFEGFVNIPEGETVDRIHLRNSNRVKLLNFSIHCDDFDVKFYETGAPKEYRSSLTILKNGRAVLKKDIIVNDPLHYDGINIFQSSYGALAPKGVTLNFKSTATGMQYSVSATVGVPVVIPEAGGEFVIKDYRSSYNFRGRNIAEVFLGTLTPRDGQPLQVVLPLRFPEFDRMRKGKWVVSAVDPQYWYYTGLQVTSDPSVGVVYAGFIIMIIGCYITFFMSHQRIFIEVTSRGDFSQITVYGTANKNKLGVNKKVKNISQKLKGLGK